MGIIRFYAPRTTENKRLVLERTIVRVLKRRRFDLLFVQDRLKRRQPITEYVRPPRGASGTRIAR